MVLIRLMAMKIELKVVRNSNPKQPEKKPQNRLPEFREPREMRRNLSGMTPISISVSERLSHLKNTMLLFHISFHFLKRVFHLISSSGHFHSCIRKRPISSEITIFPIPIVFLSKILRHLIVHHIRTELFHSPHLQLLLHLTTRRSILPYENVSTSGWKIYSPS